MPSEIQDDAEVVRAVLEAWRDDLVHEFDIELAGRSFAALDRLEERLRDAERRADFTTETLVEVVNRAQALEAALYRGARDGESEAIRAWCSLTLAALPAP